MFCDKHSNHIFVMYKNGLSDYCMESLTNPLKSYYISLEVQTIHVKSLQSLMTEVYKSLHHINPEFMWDLFCQKCIQYNLRISNLLVLPKIKNLIKMV